ncbi:MAG: hypothetical protein AB7H66_16230 [Hyphomonadaceae bacterium]
MANSVIQAFVSGTRALLSAQLVVAVGAVAVAGWTLGVTNQLIRERDRLQERVIQLEETIAARGEIPPPPAAVVQVQAARGDIVYPGSIANAFAPAIPSTADAAPIVAAPPVQSDRNFGSIVTSLFGPAPPLRTVVLHVRAQQDADEAARIASALQRDGVRVLIAVAPQGDQRPPGYAYFDGRQSRTAADAVSRFHEAARELQLAQWSAQVRGTALPAQGEYTADRLDIMLPALPAPPAPLVEPGADAPPG